MRANKARGCRNHFADQEALLAAAAGYLGPATAMTRRLTYPRTARIR